VPLAPSTAVKDPRVKLADDVFITSVEWHKRKAHPFHEFLIFHVKQRGSGRTTVILVERNGAIYPQATKDTDKGDDYMGQGDGSKSKVTAPSGAERTSPLRGEGSYQAAGTQQEVRAPQQPSPRNSFMPRSSSSESSSSIKGASAEDVLVFSASGSEDFARKREYDYYLLRSFTITGDHFSVPQLAVLANVVHQNSPNYQLFDRQCYWYAVTIYSTVKALCPERATTEKITPQSKEAGKFHFATVTQPTELADKDIVKRFNEDWATMMADIAQIRANIDAQKQREIEEARAPVERARQQAEAARQQAEARADALEEQLRALRRQNGDQGASSRSVRNVAHS